MALLWFKLKHPYQDAFLHVAPLYRYCNPDCLLLVAALKVRRRKKKPNSKRTWEQISI